MMSYSFGCVLAFIALAYIYYHTPSEDRCDNTSAAIVYLAGTLGSWVTIVLIVVSYLFGDSNNNLSAE